MAPAFKRNREITTESKGVKMIVEVRTYRIKSGRRDEFIRTFLTRSIPAHHAIGMQIFGPLLDVEHPDTFVFLRAFPSMGERDRMKAAFYDGELWKQELESILMPMIDSYDVVLTEPSDGCVTFSV